MQQTRDSSVYGAIAKKTAPKWFARIRADNFNLKIK